MARKMILVHIDDLDGTAICRSGGHRVDAGGIGAVGRHRHSHRRRPWPRRVGTAGPAAQPLTQVGSFGLGGSSVQPLPPSLCRSKG